MWIFIIIMQIWRLPAGKTDYCNRRGGMVNSLHTGEGENYPNRKNRPRKPPLNGDRISKAASMCFGELCHRFIPRRHAIMRSACVCTRCHLTQWLTAQWPPRWVAYVGHGRRTTSGGERNFLQQRSNAFRAAFRRVVVLILFVLL